MTAVPEGDDDGRERRPRFRLIVFDFDGTLADSFPFFVRNLNALAARFGFRHVAPDDVERLRTYDTRRILTHVGVPLWRLPAVAAAFRSLMAERIGEIVLFEGVEDVLRTLAARGYVLAVASSNSEDNVRRVLGPSARLFGHLECGASLLGKRRRIRRLAARTGTPAERILCIGDETRDIEAAQAERCGAAAVAWGYAAPSALAAHDPVALFARPAEILDLLP